MAEKKATSAKKAETPKKAAVASSAKKAEPIKTAVKKTQPAKPSATAKKAEPVKAAPKKAEPVKATTAKKAEPVKAAPKKAEPAKPTATAKKAEPIKTAPKKAEPAKPTATVKKAEPVKAAPKKAEPAKATATAKKAEPVKAAPKKEEPTDTAKNKSFAQRRNKSAADSEASAALAGARTASSKKSVKDERAPQLVADKKVENKKRGTANSSDGNNVNDFNGRDNSKAHASSETAIADPNVKKLILIITSVILIVVLLMVLVLSIQSCISKRNPIETMLQYDSFEYNSKTEVGYAGAVTGTVERYRPVKGEPQDGGLSEYPTYGRTLSSVLGTSDDKVAARNALIAESSYLTATGTANAGGGNYVWMDEDGYLYNGTTAAPEETVDKYTGKKRQLYKHTASVGLYLGDVDDNEPGIVKEVYMRPRGYNSYGVTGVYAPAGEVIKIQISEEDMEATGGLVIHIGQALYNGQANNIWTAKNQMQRIPHLLNTMVVNKNTSTLENGVYTAYVGSFIGGPIYIRNTLAAFTATISGGVAYQHFILGYTTQNEFEENAKSSAPYFDLEVWDYGVLHSGPKFYAQNFSYSDIYDAAVLWDKISLVSNKVRSQGIVFLYDPFVAAGAAVAFPGRRSVNCPAGWMSGSLNCKAFEKSGSWGNMHEFNHNFQGWGISSVGGEVTNNALNLVEYSLFTKISSARGMGNYGAAGLSGWNNYTCASWAVKQIAGDSAVLPGNPLSMYAVLLHSFGQENFMNTTNISGTDRYFTAWSEAVHYDMTYYAEQLANVYNGRFGGYPDMGAEAKANMKSKNYPMFVPVASVYQTGRSYNYNGEKRYIQTMQPYVIPYDKEFTVDLRGYVDAITGSIVLPEGFDFTIKNVSDPEYGKIVKTEEDKVYKYIPNKKNMRSGKIIVTLGITKNDGAFTVEDVDLVLEFEQSHETTKWTTERTTYTYSNSSPFATAQEAYEKKYAGYSDKADGDNINPTLNGRVVQNCNSEVWFISDPGKNTVVEIRGKYHAEEAAKYRIALRGRWSTALYIATVEGEGQPKDSDYQLAATYNQVKPSSNASFPNTPGTYKDLELGADTWVHYKAVMLVDTNGSTISFMGVGWGKFTPELGTFDEETGELIGYQPESVSVGYVNAYRSSYESPKSEFESEYFYTRSYNDFEYKYGELHDSSTQKTLPEYTVNLTSGWGGSTDISILTDGVKDQGGALQIHTASGQPTAEKPLEFVIDMGSVCKANRLTVYSQPNRVDPSFIRQLNLFGSTDGVKFDFIKSFDGVAYSSGAGTQVFDFDTCEIRYYKLSITASTARQLILREVEMRYVNEAFNGRVISPDDVTLKYKGTWNGAQAASTFGHVIVGNKNATVSFEFEGNRIAILSSTQWGQKFEVKIDGKTVKVDDINKSSGKTVLAYVSTKLKQGKHKVTIKCVGMANIDSIAVFSEPAGETA